MKTLIFLALSIVALSAHAETDENVAKMRGDKNGVSRVKDWGTTEQSAHFFLLHQVDNGSALFVYTGDHVKEYQVAVRVKGMKHAPQKGQPLTWFVDCVKFRKVIETKDRDGMDLTIISFEPAQCTDGRS